MLKNMLQPQAIYGYFLVRLKFALFAPEEMNHKEALNTQEPVATFEFPRQRSLRRLCIADFMPKESVRWVCSRCKR